MDISELTKKLKREGYVHIFEWRDEPATEYPLHAHTGKVVMYILEGGLTFHFGARKVTLKVGDRFDVPVGEKHTALVGPDGCHYLVGEMINGDS